MSHLKTCCGNPPVILTGKNALGNTVYSVTCLFCGRHEISAKREYAVKKFNGEVKPKCAKAARKNVSVLSLVRK